MGTLCCDIFNQLIISESFSIRETHRWHSSLIISVLFININTYSKNVVKEIGNILEYCGLMSAPGTSKSKEGLERIFLILLFFKYLRPLWFVPPLFYLCNKIVTNPNGKGKADSRSNVVCRIIEAGFCFVYIVRTKFYFLSLWLRI